MSVRRQPHSFRRACFSGASSLYAGFWAGWARLPGRAEIDQRLDDILSRPEFEPPQPGLLDRILGWLGEFFGDLLSLFIDENGRADVLLIVLITALLAGLTVLIVRLIRQRRPAKAETPTASAPTLKDHSSQELLRHADELAEANLVSDAFSYLLFAHLKALSENGILTLTPGRTNRQYQSDLRCAEPRICAAFSAFCLAFNERRYGETPALLPDYLLWRGRLFGRREAAG